MSSRDTEIGERNERTESDTPRESRLRRFRRYIRDHPRTLLVMLVVLMVLAAAGAVIWHHFSIRESTDDARIDGYVVNVSARVTGQILSVRVEENDHIQEGQVLVVIDPRDYQVVLDRTKAELAAAQASAQAAQANVPITSTSTQSQLQTAQAGTQEAEAGVEMASRQVEAERERLAAARAQLNEAQAARTKAQLDLARYKKLVEKDEIARQVYDTAVTTGQQTQAAVEAAQANVRQAEQAVQVAESGVQQARAKVTQARSSVKAAGTGPQRVQASKAQLGTAEATVQQRQAQLAQAQLNLAYTTVEAPVTGVVGTRSAQPGHIVQPGQPLLSIVPLENIWVTANFKETQLKNMRTGQEARVDVDAYGGRTYNGQVESIGPATRATFSVLPPENASGNFVKVVQRVPVRIRLRKGQDPEHLLRPGMSVEATVLTGAPWFGW
jgi:membrane fusion protein, multidrug efflux system